MSSSTNSSAGAYGSLIREHEELKSRIHDEQSWWKICREFGKPQFGEMSHRLGCLKTRLAAHFAHEDSLATGLRTPGGQPPSAELLRNADEHRDMLARLESIISKAAACEGYCSWGELGLEFSEFIQDLEQHESVELEALRELSQSAVSASVT